MKVVDHRKRELDELYCPFCLNGETTRISFDEETEVESRFCPSCKHTYFVYWKRIPESVVAKI